MNFEREVLSELYNCISESKQHLYDKIASDRTRYLTVALENIRKEHNASAVLRTCDCFGVQHLHTIESNTVYEAQRDIAMGASKWVDVTSHTDEENPTLECLQSLRSNGYKIIATSPHAQKTVEDISLESPIALVFGTERHGISEDTLQFADESVKIPMYGFTESFNVSVAVAILLNTLRNRLEASNLNWKLSEKEQINLKINWCTYIINNGPKVLEEIRRRIIEKE